MSDFLGDDTRQREHDFHPVPRNWGCGRLRHSQRIPKDARLAHVCVLFRRTLQIGWVSIEPAVGHNFLDKGAIRYTAGTEEK